MKFCMKADMREGSLVGISVRLSVKVVCYRD